MHSITTNVTIPAYFSVYQPFSFLTISSVLTQQVQELVVLDQKDPFQSCYASLTSSFFRLHKNERRVKQAQYNTTQFSCDASLSYEVQSRHFHIHKKTVRHNKA